MPSPAAKVAAHKAENPEKYCLMPRCLWRTDAPFCPRHQPREAPYKAQARRIAEQYNRLAEAEQRPDLEETE